MKTNRNEKSFIRYEKNHNRSALQVKNNNSTNNMFYKLFNDIIFYIFK